MATISSTVESEANANLSPGVSTLQQQPSSSTSASQSQSPIASEDLEKQSRSPPSTITRVRDHFHVRVISTSQSTTLLLVLTLATGIQDAITFPTYHCFTSNQTGNTIFLTLALILPASQTGSLFSAPAIALALCCFLIGAFLTGQLANHLSCQTKRHYLTTCNATQTILVLVAAGLEWQYPPLSPNQDIPERLTITSTGLVTIGLLAFASGSQTVQSRSLATPEIPTAMATAAWVDLVIDPYLFRLHGKDTRGRNRRLLFLTALVVGGLLGAEILRFAGRIAGGVAILVSGVLKLCVVIGYCLIRCEATAEVNKGERDIRKEKIDALEQCMSTEAV